ncbi:unnamed protein product, partial [Sphacelaria rigidula]
QPLPPTTTTARPRKSKGKRPLAQLDARETFDTKVEMAAVWPGTRGDGGGASIQSDTNSRRDEQLRRHAARTRRMEAVKSVCFERQNLLQETKICVLSSPTPGAIEVLAKLGGGAA